MNGIKRMVCEIFMVGIFYIPAKLLATDGHVFAGLLIFGIFSYVYGFIDGCRKQPQEKHNDH